MPSFSEAQNGAESDAQHFNHVLGSWYRGQKRGAQVAECMECGAQAWANGDGNYGGDACSSECWPMGGV